MATYAAEETSVVGISIPEIRERVRATLGQEPFRPWCVHGLYEELTDLVGLVDREGMLMRTQLAADELAAGGEIHREAIHAYTIGVECQDTLYWSKQSGIDKLEGFGPDYESPTILRRLGAHFQCHGL
ncbi:MAG TPA: hypothetical protein VGP88_06960 [Thermoplasmata archaeon]|jgi:hypothetical protein|nr:hypothetical protein [Thermoplasmata archaeon]